MPRKWYRDQTCDKLFYYDRRSDSFIYDDGTSRQRPDSIPLSTFDESTPRALIGDGDQQPSRSQPARPTRTSASDDQSRDPAPRPQYGSPPQEPAYVYSTTQGGSPPPAPPSSRPAPSLNASLQNLSLGRRQSNAQEQQLQQYQQYYQQQQQQQRSACGLPGSGPYGNSYPNMAPPPRPEPPQIPGYPSQFPAQRTESNGLQLLTAYNPSADVRTTIATAPKIRITDPNLTRRGVTAHNMLIGNGQEGDTERLYSSFKVRKHDFFAVGRVFLVLWVEPAGTTVVTDLQRNDGGILPGRYQNEYIFSKVRRFVVIREADSYCSALPIASYGHQGVGKNGVVKSEHAIIYTGPEPGPASLPQEAPARNEQGMRPYSIRVIPDDPTDKLDPVSRIDFGKVNTVQHNIKVKPFGMVHQSSLSALHNQFNNVWHGEATAAAVQTSLAQNRTSGSGNSGTQQTVHAQSSQQTQAAAASRNTTPSASGMSGQAASTSLRPTHQSASGASAGRYITLPQIVSERASGRTAERRGSSTGSARAISTASGNSRQKTPAAVPEDDEGEEDSDEEDEDSDDDTPGQPPSQARSTTSQTSQLSALAQSARNTFNQLRGAGYSREQAMDYMVVALQRASPGMTREAAQASIRNRLAYQGD